MAAPLFGVALTVVMGRPNERTIPTFVKKVVRYLNAEAIYTDGIFRLAAKPDALQELKNRVDAGEDVDFASYNDHHLIAALLKAYLRELPEPLFTYELYPKLITAATAFEKRQHEGRASSAILGMAAESEANSATQRFVEELIALIDSLPPPHKALTEVLFLFLSRIGEHSARNKMTPNSLAVVFGSILIRLETETVETMMNSSKVTGITKFLIERFDDIFPNQAVKSVRRQPSLMVEGMAQVEEQELTDKQKIEAEKLEKIKETVDDAICILQKKLNNLSTELKTTNSLEVAIDIARRVRTAKKVLFVPGQEPKKRTGATATSSSSLSKKRKPSKKKRDDLVGFVAFEFGHCSLQGKRNHMEDNHAIFEDLRSEFPDLPADKQWAYFAVYDGHGGSETSRCCSEILHKHIAKTAEFASGRITEAFAKGFVSADNAIILEGQQRGFKDGSTAVVAVVHDGKIFVGNAGDSEAVLCKRTAEGKVEWVILTEKHLATNEKERKRIEALDGAVFSGRVFGTLAISRSLGDRDYKMPTSEANFVSSEPHTSVVTVSDDDQFLLLACDGLWEKLSYAAACDFVLQQFANDVSAQDVSAALAQEAINLGSMDNVTAIVIRLNVK